jgi:hypothetical protein
MLGRNAINLSYAQLNTVLRSTLSRKIVVFTKNVMTFEPPYRLNHTKTLDLPELSQEFTHKSDS